MFACCSRRLDALSAKISDCVGDIADWARSNRLMLNPDKWEAIWHTTSRRQHQLSTAAIPVVGVQSLQRGPSVISADLSMRAHAKRTVSRCFAALRQLRQIHRAVPTATFQMLVVALLHSRLDYSNAVLVASLPGTPFAVGAQCGGTTHLPSATVRPHLWCVGDTALAARPRTRAVQNRGANVQNDSRRCAAIGLYGTSCRLSPSLTCTVGELRG